MRVLSLFLAIAANSTPLVQDQVKVGSLRFTPPVTWKATAESGPTAAIYTPANLPAGKQCVIKVYPEEFDKDGFRPWFNRRWNRTVTGAHQVLRMSELASEKIEGVDTLIRSAAHKIGNGEGYILSIGLSVEGKFICVSYEANDYALMERHQNEVYDMFDTFDLVGGGAVPAGRVDPPGTGKTTEPKSPAGGTPTGANRVDRTAWAEETSPVRLSRLTEIARSLQDPKSDGVKLLTEAAQLCGFAIWSESRAKIAEPTGSPRLGLVVTDVEIKQYVQMFRAGHQVNLRDLIGAIDVIYKGIGATSSCEQPIVTWLLTGFLSGNPSNRALVSFLHDLGAMRSEGGRSIISDSNAVLDPIQALLILRVITEDISVPLRKAIHKLCDSELLVSLFPEPVDFEIPGWVEDAYVGAVTTINDLAVEVLDAADTKLGKVNKWMGLANTAASLAKFIATYVYLKGELRVESPGQPLIRTKDLHAGDERTIIAKFQIDGTAVTDWMKDNRILVAQIGLDLDAPKTEVLKNVETFWDVDQSKFPSKQLIRTVRGGGGLDKVRTDEKGEAKVVFEGAPQNEVLDPKRIVPLYKHVHIRATPQVKEVEVKQDIVDAVLGAIGIRSGPVGFITPLMETLYRLKWQGAASMILEVKDWSPFNSVGQFDIKITGSGLESSKDSSYSYQINRSLEFIDVGMDESGGEALSAIDPRILSSIPEAQRKQAEEAMRKAAVQAKKKLYTGVSPGAAKIHIHDRRLITGADGCTLEKQTHNTTWDGDYDGPFATRAADGTEMMFRLEVDTEAKTVALVPLAGLKVKYVNIFKSGTDSPITTKRDITMGMFTGLKFKAPFEDNKPLVIQLKESPIFDNNAYANLFGRATIKFTFGVGNKFQGEAEFTYSITRKYKK